MWHCPKLDRDVSYESGTELRVIQLLSFAPQIAYYQEQPLAISYEFAGQQRTYYPDLLAATVDGRCILIEVKPVYEMAMGINVAKYRATEEFCRLRGWGLVATDGNRTRRLLEHRTVDPRLEMALAAALDAQGELTWPQVVAAADSPPLDTLDLCSLILKHGWTWHSRPYRLRPAPPSNRPSTPSDPVVPAPDRLPRGDRSRTRPHVHRPFPGGDRTCPHSRRRLDPGAARGLGRPLASTQGLEGAPHHPVESRVAQEALQEPARPGLDCCQCLLARGFLAVRVATSGQLHDDERHAYGASSRERPHLQ